MVFFSFVGITICDYCFLGYGLAGVCVKVGGPWVHL